MSLYFRNENLTNNILRSHRRETGCHQRPFGHSCTVPLPVSMQTTNLRLLSIGITVSAG